eukprot:scaffold9802_cov100-Isochrysis_galbana.AAC.4
MNPAGKVDHWAFCTILPFRPGPGAPSLPAGAGGAVLRTTNAGCGRKDDPTSKSKAFTEPPRAPEGKNKIPCRRWPPRPRRTGGGRWPGTV